MTGSQSSGNSGGSGGSGGGGGAGAGGAGGAVTASMGANVLAKQLRYANDIVAGNVKKVTFSEEKIPVKTIEIVTNKDVKTSKLTVLALKSKPADVQDNQNLVYQYLDINQSGLPESVVEEANITFVVQSSWLAENNVTDQQVVLMHWDVIEWDELPTRVVNITVNKTTFVATAEHFSVFAITARRSVTQEAPTADALTQSTDQSAESTPEAQNAGGQESVTEKKRPAVLFWAIIGFLVVAAIVTFLLYKKSHHTHQRKW